MEASCLQLSIEGERLLKAQKYQEAINHFEAGLRVGTDDIEVLSAVYNQLGNACFYIGKYHKALEYHKKDLEVAERQKDLHGQAKAYGNLGNTFKSLRNYPSAIKCCEAHLRITREINDKLGEGRACYNLGNVHHAVGKGKMATKTAEGTAEGKKDVLRAIELYKKTVSITVAQNDISGEGRAVGNLGNAYTAIGEFNEAIVYHKRRLKIANDQNDFAAKARACGNLGNAYSATNEFGEALKCYHLSLTVAKAANNQAGTGQAYYCLGSTYALLKNWPKAIEFHTLHVEVSTELHDDAGRLRGWYNLRNAHHAMNEKAMKQNLGKDEFHTAKVIEYHKLIQQHQPMKNHTSPEMAAPNIYGKPSAASTSGSRANPKEHLSAVKKAEKKKQANKPNGVQTFSVSDSDSDDDDMVHNVVRNTGQQRSKALHTVSTEKRRNAADAWLDNAISEESSVTMDDVDRYADLKKREEEEEMAGFADEFFDMLAAANGSAMDSQRAAAPGEKHGSSTPEMIGASGYGGTAGDEEQEALFDLLVQMQNGGNRIDNQRAGGERLDGLTAAEAQAKMASKLDDDMDFFSMLEAAKR